MLSLRLDEVDDFVIKENLQRLQDHLLQDVLPRGKWKFFQITVPAAFTNLKYKHNLGFVPKDIIQTSLIGSTLVWNYSSFTINDLSMTTGGAVTVRAFIGSYLEGSGA